MKKKGQKLQQRMLAPAIGTWIRLLLPFLAAACLLLPGQDENVFNLLGKRWFHLPFFGTAATFLLITSAIDLVTSHLDKKYPWKKQFQVRLGLQLLAGWIFPAGLAFLFASLYFDYLGVNIMDTLYSRHMLPLAVLLILPINLALILADGLPDSKQEETAAGSAAPVYPDHLLIPFGSGLTKVETVHLAYIFRSSEDVLAKTHDNVGYVLRRSLDEIEPQLDPKHFFRINRAFIISRTSFRSYRRRPDGGLYMTIHPNVNELNVSRTKAKAVLKWLDS